MHCAAPVNFVFSAVINCMLSAMCCCGVAGIMFQPQPIRIPLPHVINQWLGYTPRIMQYVLFPDTSTYHLAVC